MGGISGDDQALVIGLQRQVETLQALYLDYWKPDESRNRSLIGRLIYGTGPRSRYAKTNEIIALRDALTELIGVVYDTRSITDLQRRQMRQVGQEIDSWRSPGKQEPDFPEHKNLTQDQISKGKRTPDPGKEELSSEKENPGQEDEEPSLEELWQIICDVECLTIEIADDGWLGRRLELEESLSSPDVPTGIGGAGRHGATTSPGTEVERGDLDSVRHRLLVASRHRARSARQRRGDEKIRAERLTTAGVLAFPAAIFTAAFFSWAVYWPGGVSSGSGIFVGSALAVFGGALGGGLARLLRLRDAPLGTLEADQFRRAFAVQMLLGGAFGVIALMLVQLDALPKVGNGGEAEMIALYAFLAGWSEPFILGVLNRLGSSGDRPPGRRNDPAG